MKQNNAVMKKESEEMFIKLKAVIKIQNRFRYIRSSLNKSKKSVDSRTFN